MSMRALVSHTVTRKAEFAIARDNAGFVPSLKLGI